MATSYNVRLTLSGGPPPIPAIIALIITFSTPQDLYCEMMLVVLGRLGYYEPFVLHNGKLEFFNYSFKSEIFLTKLS